MTDLSHSREKDKINPVVFYTSAGLILLFSLTTILFRDFSALPDRLHSQFGHFRHSIHQRCLSIKAVIDWTFNIKCVLIVTNLILNGNNNSGDTG